MMETTVHSLRPLRENRELIARQIGLADRIALFLDFDGTLAPIVERPELAFPSEPIRKALASLATKKKLAVGIISGRQLTDVRDRIAVENVVFAGNHGLEIEMTGDMYLDPTAVGARPDLETIRDSLAAKLAHIPGVFLEDKGLSLSVHFRLVPPEHVEKVRSSVHEELARSGHPFVLSTGQMVLEIRPRSHWTKADAVKWIVDRQKLEKAVIIFMGDDVTDEDAFAAYPDQITIRVGASDTSAARFYVEHIDEVHEFLEWLHQFA